VPTDARFAVLSDTHLAPPGTPDGMWNNVTCLSTSHDLLAAAVADIAAAGIGDVVLLGDVSDGGDPRMIAKALQVVTTAGMRAWTVPGNHDATVSPDAIAEAVKLSPGSTLIAQECPDSWPDIAMYGHGLRSNDRGQTCEAINLPNPAGICAQLLLWATHYPVLSQYGRFRTSGLRYPGDLRNLSDIATCITRFNGPVLILHGHLHAAAIKHAGPMLQIGVPAAVEWPHAWTEAKIKITESEITVQTALKPIPGTWPASVTTTVLCKTIQNWTFTSRRWVESEVQDVR
jgi:Calcineurin-like phosphoesterase